MNLVVRSPSDELLVLIKAAASNLFTFGELWKSIKKKGRDEGFSETELEDMIRPLLKPKLNKDQIYYLFHKEEKIEQVRSNTRRKFPTDDGKKETEESNTENLEKQIEEVTKTEGKDSEQFFEKEEADKAQQEYEKEKLLEETSHSKSITPKMFTTDDAFQSLPDDNSLTCWKIDRIAGNALKNKINSWQGNTTKFFRVWMQEVNK